MPHGDLNGRVTLGWLLDFYGGLLTEKQRSVLSMYCEEDLSLSEIAAETGISRQGVHEQLTRAAERLNGYEEALGVAARFRDVEDGLRRSLELLRSQKYDEAEALLERVLQREQEENDGLRGLE